MTIRDLLNDNSIWPCLFTSIEDKFEKNRVPKLETVTKEDLVAISDVTDTYGRVIMQLLSFPYNPHDYVINVALVEKDEFSDEEYIDVSLKDPIKDLVEDLSSIPWKEVIDLDIEITSNLSAIEDCQLLTEIMWELTTWGFDSEVENSAKTNFSNFLAGFLKGDLDRN